MQAATSRQSRLLWHATSSLNAQLHSLTPAILSPTSGLNYLVSVKGTNVSTTPIISLLKNNPSASGNLVLITVNCDRINLVAQYTFKSSDAPIPAAHMVHALFEGMDGELEGKRPVPVRVDASAGTWSFVDSFEPFEDHTYLL